MTEPNRIDKIKLRITNSLKPSHLEIIDEGYMHIGHAEEGAGHFAIVISSPAFANKKLLDCHRMIYDALGEMMDQEIHALRIKIK